jgi:MFS family permease
VLTAATAVLPETVRPLPGALASLRPRVAVPAAARRAFAGAAPTMLATWALGGLMFSVGGSLVRTVFGAPNSAVVGLVLGVFAGSAAVAGVLVSHLAPAPMERLGTAALTAGTGLFLGALGSSSLALFVVASAVAGAGFGSGFLGTLRSVTQLARPHERAALLSAVYVTSYLAFSIPALVAGVLITRIGLRDTALYYGGLVGVAALVSLGAGVLAARPRRLVPAVEESVRAACGAPQLEPQR